MKDEWMEIVNVDKLTDFTRKVIFHNFDNQNNRLTDQEFLEKVKRIKSEDSEEMERLLPFNEVRTILKSFLKKRKNKKTQEIKLFMKESDYDQILLEFNQRMISNIVQGLVKKGVLETAFDDEKNDFVFWVKNNQDEE